MRCGRIRCKGGVAGEESETSGSSKTFKLQDRFIRVWRGYRAQCAGHPMLPLFPRYAADPIMQTPCMTIPETMFGLPRKRYVVVQIAIPQRTTMTRTGFWQGGFMRTGCWFWFIGSSIPLLHGGPDLFFFLGEEPAFDKEDRRYHTQFPFPYIKIIIASKAGEIKGDPDSGCLLSLPPVAEIYESPCSSTTSPITIPVSLPASAALISTAGSCYTNT